ncbi:hypothetical protein [Paraburkholderia sp. C35]|uniref:hypothetical protein n=1 Tax=Paraburkholderia sp. C35 TaxID=2126993 RepID=UPI0013A5996E|nr:hypothetical protein [Paraburkholderia sp. C35]
MTAIVNDRYSYVDHPKLALLYAFECRADRLSQQSKGGGRLKRGLEYAEMLFDGFA